MALAVVNIAHVVVCIGHRHASVAMSYGNMGYVYRSLGKADEAREMFTKTYSIFLKVLGPDHPHTQKAKQNQM